MGKEVPAGVRATGVEELTAVAGLAWFEVDRDRNVISMSPALEELTGFRAEEVVGASCLTLIRCQECLKGCGVFRTGEVRSAPLKLFRSDGSEVEVTKSGQVFRDDDGTITGALEVLEPAESRGGHRHLAPPPEMDILLSGLGRVFLVADEEFRVVTHSSALPEMVGLPVDELRGVAMADLLGTDLFGPESSFRAGLEAGELREGWRAYLRTDRANHRAVSVSAGPLDAAELCGGGGGRYAIMIRSADEVGDVPSFAGMVARSPAMQRIFRLIDLLRDNDSSVLISGESGTGKELVARALHTRSHRKGGPFVAVNCAAIPSELLESELFGHVKGAFTGAVKDRMGRVEAADGGTLFLDEIGDLAPALQAKLLRFLQDRTFERVGETRTRQVDVRVISATHMNLMEAVHDRRFREDLYYRLRVVPIDIPPLRARREDLELLIQHLLDGASRKRGRALRLAPSANRVLLTYSWPGNVRELENALEYATAVCEGQTIHVRDLPPEVGSQEPVAQEPVAREVPPPGPREEAGFHGRGESRGPDLTPREAREVARIREALEATRWNRTEAAELLGISRTTLWRRMKEYRM